MMSAREAMANAITAAEAACPEVARAWVAIAAELRAGSAPRRPTASASEPPTTRMDLRGEATTQIGVPLRRQPGSGAMVSDAGWCAHCGLRIWRDATDGAWRHDVNDQRTCPMQSGVDAAGDETFVHTMAWPAATE